MTQSQLERAIARRTGESLQTIRHLGFRPLVPGPPIELDPDRVHADGQMDSQDRQPAGRAPRRPR